MNGDKQIERAAQKISAAMDQMVMSLPYPTSPHTAICRLVAELAKLQTDRMRWVMEDPMVRDAYEASLAEMPARRGATTDGI
jgi:hypothetical protein